MPSQTEQIVLVEPSHVLKFKGPFNEPVMAVMVLNNPSDKKIAFKIKTTTPKRYCVRPNCGELIPNEKAEILVILQPFNYDANEINKHRFLVQTVVIDPVTDYGEDGKHFQWQDIEEAKIMESKLKCSFEMPVEQLLEPENIHDQTTAVLETDAETELQIVTAEIEKLREEENFIKQKNAVLREELMKLQFIFDNHQSPKRSISDSRHLDMQNRNVNITLMISLAIIVALFGIIAGKYIF